MNIIQPYIWTRNGYSDELHKKSPSAFIFTLFDPFFGFIKPFDE